MSTTEDYLDQLLRNASGQPETSAGEVDFMENDEIMENGIEKITVGEGLSLEQAMEMSVDDVLNETEKIESELDLAKLENCEDAEDGEVSDNGMLSDEVIAAMFTNSEKEETAVEDVETEGQETTEDTVLDNGMLSEETIAAMFETSEAEETPVEAEKSEEPENAD